MAQMRCSEEDGDGRGLDRVREKFRCSSRSARRASFTILEVLVGLAVLTAGILSILAVFPATLRGNQSAELRTLAASLAMMKIEEVRRDNDETNFLIGGIQNLTEPTEPVVFALERRLAYRFSGVTMLHIKIDASGAIIDDPDDPRDDPGVARVIIQESPTFRSRPKIIAEFRFAQ